MPTSRDNLPRSQNSGKDSERTRTRNPEGERGREREDERGREREDESGRNRQRKDQREREGESGKTRRSSNISPSRSRSPVARSSESRRHSELSSTPSIDDLFWEDDRSLTISSVPEETDEEKLLHNKQRALVRSIAKSGNMKYRCDTLDAMHKESCWCARILGPFLDLQHVLHDGFALMHRGKNLNELYEKRLGNKTEEVHNKVIESLRDILSNMKTLAKWMRFIGDQDLSVIKDFCKLMGVSHRGARSDDNSRLKVLAIKFLPETPDRLPASLKPLQDDDPKHCRGWNHPQTARMLVPRDLLDIFDKDPQGFCARVLNNKIKIKADTFPTFLYAEDVKFDKKKVHEGLFRSQYLLACYRAVFTGPSSASKCTPGPSKNHRGSISEKNTAVNVTGPCLAYAATMTRYALCAQDSWVTQDGHFSLEVFYHEMLSLFEDPEDPWVVSTLKWWDYWVLGHEPDEDAAENTDPEDQVVVESTAKLFKVQRAARLTKVAPILDAGTGSSSVESLSGEPAGGHSTNQPEEEDQVPEPQPEAHGGAEPGGAEPGGAESGDESSSSEEEILVIRKGKKIAKKTEGKKRAREEYEESEGEDEVPMKVAKRITKRVASGSRDVN